MRERDRKSFDAEQFEELGSSFTLPKASDKKSHFSFYLIQLVVLIVIVLMVFLAVEK